MFPSSSDAPLFRDAEEWQSPPFLGDFYREADTVCRGVTIAPEDLSGPSGFKGFVDGDFYREPDDICKGISIGDSSFSLAPPLGKDFGLSTELGYSSTVLSQKVADRFISTDFPPNTPDDSFFQFERTTLNVTSSTPFEIGNTLLDFMSQQITSSIIKVRRPKFSIKADVFMDNMMCTMKVRVYSQGSGQFAVEFQRRSGDSISFSNAFQQAASNMQRFFAVTNAPEAPVLISFPTLSALPEGFVESSLTEEDLLPLCEMASLVGAPWLQAEAATSLSQMAAQRQPVLLRPRVFQAIAELMQQSSADVAHPTACLIFHLAQHTEAAALFASQGLLQKMLETVRSQGTHAQIRLKLAQALNSSIQHQSKSTLSDNEAMELSRGFSDCASKEVLNGSLSHEVIQNLEMAELALKTKFGASG